MKTVIRYITEDGNEFDTKQEALDYEEYLNNDVADFTFKYPYSIGDIVWVCSRGFIWECVLQRENFYIEENYVDYLHEITYAKARFNSLLFRSISEPKEDFHINSMSQLESVSKNITGLIKTNRTIGVKFS